MNRLPTRLQKTGRLLADYLTFEIKVGIAQIVNLSCTPVESARNREPSMLNTNHQKLRIWLFSRNHNSIATRLSIEVLRYRYHYKAFMQANTLGSNK